MSPTETILQQLLNTLQDEFETILRAYPATYDNCPGVQAWHFGLPDLRRASQMPLVAIDLDRQSLQTRTLGGFGTGKRERLIPAQLIIAHAHRDEEQLMRQLLQLTDALAQTLEAITQTPNWLIQEVELADYTPPLETETNAPFIRFATLRLTIRDRHPRGMP
jgi:hypothetical protein